MRLRDNVASVASKLNIAPTMQQSSNSLSQNIQSRLQRFNTVVA